MGSKFRRKVSNEFRSVFTILAITFVFLFSSCNSAAPTDFNGVGKTPPPSVVFTAPATERADVAPTAKALETTPPTAKPTAKPERPLKSFGALKVYFLDVGQADSILITVDGSSMLIDAGNNSDGSGIVDYLKGKGITKLDYVVATHPHEDHIGGMDDVIYNFDIGKVIMSKATATTKTYRDVISAKLSKGISTSYSYLGERFSLKGAKFEVLSPDKLYDDTNENSIVLRMVFGSESFIFCGDADYYSEATMLANDETVDSDVIKIGHHGSISSSTTDFLEAVSPDYAVISVGEGNSYGHPTAGALSRIANVGAKLFRTDRDGTVIFSSDGNTIKVTKVATSIDG